MSAREVSGATRVPLPILTNILKTLAGAGMVVSERGVNGGYSLARAADGITLFDLVSAIEGPFHLIQCIVHSDNAGKSGCELEPCCPIRLPALRVHDRMKDFLRSVTLTDLMENQTTPVQIGSSIGMLELESAPT